MFEPGVRVRLMSGGPVMTVMQRESDGHYRCTWFKDGKPTEYYFPEAVLEAVESGPSVVAASFSKRW